MPKKKTLPDTKTAPEQTDSVTREPTPKPFGRKAETPAIVPPQIETNPVSESPVDTEKKPANKWMLISGTVVTGLLLGFLLSYLLFIKPMQDQLNYSADRQNNGEVSSNQIKSDLSNTRLRQQEMEIRYLTATARLDSANQYIFLLRMKEKVAVARLMVEQKNGLEARKALADIKTLYDHLSPYIKNKDAAAADELDSLIQSSIQNLTNDPESASSSLANIASNLERVEAALFRME